VPLVASSFVVEGEIELSLVGVPNTLPVTVENQGFLPGVNGVLPVDSGWGVVQGVVIYGQSLKVATWFSR
jgi:hypothetical protein